MKASPDLGGNSNSRLRATFIAVAVSASVPCVPAWSQSVIDADANTILVAMTDNLKGLKELSADYDADHEIIDLAGQKLQYSASGSIVLSRGKGLRLTRKGPYADVEVTFDGKQISLYGKGMNVYAQMESPGASLDEAVEEFRISTGLDVPGADLLSNDPYPLLTEGVASGSLVGTAFVGGVECNHLAFRNDIVDWQIWIAKGEEPLPLKYVITTKWVTGAPEYSLRLSNWKTKGVDATQFAFKVPEGAKKLEQIHADAAGELSLEPGE